MTFKNIKFDESAVMRSLEKVAHEKGLIKSEPTSVKTLDLKPSKNLKENMLKLTAGLRDKGLFSQAKLIEDRMIEFLKYAELYPTKDHGIDLLEEAHPEGSVDVGNSGELGEVEDLVALKKRLMKIVEKKPLGKLSAKAAVALIKKAQEENDDFISFSAYAKQLNKSFRENSAVPAYSVYWFNMFRGVNLKRADGSDERILGFTNDKNLVKHPGFGLFAKLSKMGRGQETVITLEGAESYDSFSKVIAPFINNANEAWKNIHLRIGNDVAFLAGLNTLDEMIKNFNNVKRIISNFSNSNIDGWLFDALAASNSASNGSVFMKRMIEQMALSLKELEVVKKQKYQEGLAGLKVKLNAAKNKAQRYNRPEDDQYFSLVLQYVNESSSDNELIKKLKSMNDPELNVADNKVLQVLHQILDNYLK